MRNRQVFVNGKIYTADGNQNATAFVVENGRFFHVGSDSSALSLAQEGGTVRDMQGARIIPGMMDTHCHFVMMSLIKFDEWLPIDFYASHDEVLAVLKEYAKNHTVEECPIIRGLGYGLDCKTLATELDRAVNDRPVLLLDSGGHSGWFNTKMIERIGLDANTPDPRPGKSYFSRDERGNPTGQVIETEAELIIIEGAGIACIKNITEKLPEQIDLLHSFGITALYDAGFIMASEKEVYEALASLDLDIQFFSSFHFNGSRPNEEMLSHMIEARDQYSSDWLHPTTLKMFKDGTIEPWTAYMFEDYYPPAIGHGASLHSTEEMVAMALIAAKEDFNIHTHAVGDRAITETLDVYKQLGKIEGTKTIAHVQVLPEDGIERFTEQSEVFFQTTPVWLERDKETDAVLGEERSCRQSPFKTLLEKGVTFTFGSDAPVSGGKKGINPFSNTYYCVARSFDSDLVFPPRSEGIEVASCIDAYTINAAKQVCAENDLGSITAGKQAHFVVLDRDVFEIDWREIKDVQVAETWYRGICVHEAT